MVDVVPVSALDGKENSREQRSAGKRSRDSLHDTISKRPALACLSNHVDSISERQQRDTKKCFQPRVELLSVFDTSSLPPSLPCLNTPGGVASPMIVSSSSALVCSETMDTPEHMENNDHTCCADYANEIFSYLREAEVRYQPRVGYMLKQPDITASMRCVLVDWLVEVVDEFSLQHSTLYLAVSIIDRFLSRMSVLRGKLQLLGSTAMYIAAKLEEIYPPELSDFAYITDNTYTRQQIVRMEQLILQALDYHLLAPSSASFMEYYITDTCPGSENSPAHLLAQYLCELALMHSDPFLKYLPSQMAAASVCLARHSLGQQPAWPPSLHSCTGYTVSDIGHCLQDMHRMFAMATCQPQQAVRLRYSSEKFLRVAQTTVPETLPV